MASKVIGQTGSVVLSTEMIQHKKSKKRTVRYHYVRMSVGWRAEVIGPFHSTLYGACGFGASRKRAKEALTRNLANNYSYLGRLLFSDVDSADTVGIVRRQVFNNGTLARPITKHEAVGSAGR